MRSNINLKSLKEFAVRELPVGSPLREVLVSEPDEAEVNEFLARLPLYLKLVALKTARSL